MVYQQDMDRLVALGCDSPGCDHSSHEGPLFLHSRCHVEAPLWASYEYGSGKMKLECSKCHATVAVVAVANEDQR